MFKNRIGIAALMMVLALTMALGGTAVADDYVRPGPITSPGPNTMAWSGIGAINGLPNDVACDAAHTPDGQANTPYLYWTFTFDGGSVVLDDTTPTLHLGGSGSGVYPRSSVEFNLVHFFTPYFVPDSNLTAYVSFDAITTGSGVWGLKLTRGCPSRPQAAAPTIRKDAAGSYDNTYVWNIAKSADKTVVNQVGGDATFNYTVSASHDAGTVSNVKVNGTITVNNPGAVAINIDSITDQLSDGTVCTVTGGGAQSLPSGNSTFAYTCNLAGLPASALTNTATITWSAQTLSDGAELAAGSATVNPAVAVAFTGNDIDECVSVSDSYAGALGLVCVGGANPTAFTYSRTVPVPANGCVTYDNTATFTTNDTGATGSASQTVKVCGSSKTGALTMGFWQNKNGQAIITGQAATGVCPSTAWLRGYAPFQDLSSTATCAQVGTYVTNVIKAANASGSSMNAMLKAQMLATALDVYFSNPALGGNKINAPAPIGGVSIDLTKICKDIAGGCTILENASSAFGGATSLTVSQMLAYAASQSNVGGSTWYGNVKATQELAKDAFDAINNDKVFAP